MLAERTLARIEDPARTGAGDFEDLLNEARTAERADPETPRVGLERAAFEQTLATVVPAPRRPVLSLVAEPETPPATPPSALAEHLLHNYGSDDSLRAFGPRGVEIAAARSWLAARQRDRQSALVVSTSSTLSRLLQTLERRHLRFRLPPGSLVFDLVTAGEEWCPAKLVRDSLAVAGAECLIRAYTPAGGVTPFLAGDPGATEPPDFQAPPWTRVSTDPEGHLLILDLAAYENAGGVEITTSDWGVETGTGFRLSAPGT